jgi:solute carrier family 25 carnitine/acylcarnitine transporter 20/29
VSLLAGSFGGSIGVGVAYPLDTIKVKMQAFNGRALSSPSPRPPPAGALAACREVLRSEGVRGFYPGVGSTMLGQFFIKGAVFLSYEVAREALPGTALGLGLAAAASGVAGGVVCTPVERLKVVLQAAPAGGYPGGSLGCLRRILADDGAGGLLTRGLDATLLREVPAYFFYFTAYSFITSRLGPLLPAALLPLAGGAAAGAASWVPVYPVDVVKTAMQSETGEGGGSDAVAVARDLYKQGGFGVFWDGLTPKLIRAVINHAVTFAVFEKVCEAWTRYNLI